MRRALQNDGFTLIEVLVAMVILGIMIVAFMNVFGTAFTNIFLSGQRDHAFAQASEVLEVVYDAQRPAGLSHSALSTLLNSIGGNVQYDIVSPITPMTGMSEGHKLTIRVPYGFGRTAILETFVRGDDND